MFEDKSVASEVSELMLEFGSRLDASVALVRATCSDAEFHVYRAVVGRLMGDMLLDVMNPIYARHADLKPPQLGCY